MSRIELVGYLVRKETDLGLESEPKSRGLVVASAATLDPDVLRKIRRACREGRRPLQVTIVIEIPED